MIDEPMLTYEEFLEMIGEVDHGGDCKRSLQKLREQLSTTPASARRLRPNRGAE